MNLGPRVKLHLLSWGPRLKTPALKCSKIFLCCCIWEFYCLCCITTSTFLKTVLLVVKLDHMMFTQRSVHEVSHPFLLLPLSLLARVMCFSRCLPQARYVVMYAVNSVYSPYSSCLFDQWAANIPALRGSPRVSLLTCHAAPGWLLIGPAQLCNQEVVCSHRPLLPREFCSGVALEHWLERWLELSLFFPIS